MPLIVGLGNPGDKYAGTRHNVGFRLVDRLAKSLSIRLGPGKGPFHVGTGEYSGHKIILVKPTTYMNRSGDAVQQAVNWYKVSLDSCLVCYDDLDVDVGKLRMRPGGSAGGHNGIKDVINKVGTDAFPRLRIGIGNEFPQGQQVRFVLSPFTPEEEDLIHSALDQAVKASLCFVKEGIDNAMNKFN